MCILDCPGVYAVVCASSGHVDHESTGYFSFRGLVQSEVLDSFPSADIPAAYVLEVSACSAAMPVVAWPSGLSVCPPIMAFPIINT